MPAVEENRLRLENGKSAVRTGVWQNGCQLEQLTIGCRLHQNTYKDYGYSGGHAGV